jgi:hypothetical protein
MIALQLLVLLLSLPARPAAEDAFCAPLESGGHWKTVPATSTEPAQQGEWVTPGCRLRPWGKENLRNRRIAIVGDSVSRFLMFDLAATMFSCPPLVDCNPTICKSGVPDGIGREADSLREPCASLYRYTYVTRLHENLYLTDPKLNASLDLYWISYAEEFLRHGWVKPLFLNPKYDAFVISVGLWDVGVKPRPGLDVTPSVAHHCAWIVSHVKDMFINTLLPGNPALKRNVVYWTTSYSEPYRNPNSPTTEYERFPHDHLDTVNRCSRMTFKGALGMGFFNASNAVRAPPALLEGMLRAGNATSPSGRDGSRLLTLDGYHPNRRTRAALLDELMNYYVAMWGPPAERPPEAEVEGGGSGGGGGGGGSGGGSGAGSASGSGGEAGEGGGGAWASGSSSSVAGGEGGGSGGGLGRPGELVSPGGMAGRARRGGAEEGLSLVSILGMAVVVGVGGIAVMRQGGPAPPARAGRGEREAAAAAGAAGSASTPAGGASGDGSRAPLPPAWARLDHQPAAGPHPKSSKAKGKPKFAYY